MFKRIDELKQIKTYLTTLEKDISDISPNMYEFITNLYEIFPYKDKKIKLSKTTFSEVDYRDYIFYMIKRIENREISSQIKYFLTHKDEMINFVMSHDQSKFKNDSKNSVILENTPNDLIRYISIVGDILSRTAYGESEFLTKYYPNLDLTFYELLSICIYSNKQENKELKNDLNINKYIKHSKTIWDIHALDTLGNQSFMINYKKANESLAKDGYGKRINNINDATSLFDDKQINKVKELNSYLLSAILLSATLHDTYAFNKVYNELHKTDNLDLEVVLNNLGINYIENPKILKDIKTMPESITKVLKRD